MTDGTLTIVDGRPSLSCQRELAFPDDRVWRAISVPAELARWFPAAALSRPAVDETFDADGMGPK